MTSTEHPHAEHPHGHTRQHSEEHSGAPSHENDHSHQHGNDGGMAAMLDLDAEVLGEYLASVTGWISDLAPEQTASILDIGAGTGTGSLALARQFPAAHVTAIDSSPDMLGRVRSAAERHGLSTRIDTALADLDAGWPDLERADVAWAVSSMHHFAEPDRVLRDVFGAVKPGGLFVVIEMDDLPRFLPGDIGFGRPGLEDRLHEAMTRAGSNLHPDWHPHLTDAGFAPVDVRSFSIDADPAPPRTGEYAREFLRRCREGVGDRLEDGDRAALDRLLDDADPAGLARRTDLTISGSRTVWAARRP